MPALASLNLSDRAAFVAALGAVFEHSPWIAEETWARRPFRDQAHLRAELCATLRAAPRERQQALIRAHPDLGGRLAQPRALTAASAREQAGAGLGSLAAAELAEFGRLNDAYRARFGFPFVICARRNDKAAILAALRSRIRNSEEAEFETALGEIEKIARLRLDDLWPAG